MPKLPIEMPKTRKECYKLLVKFTREFQWDPDIVGLLCRLFNSLEI